ncbi:MAG: OadG family protein [Spirochaetales bacterium]
MTITEMLGQSGILTLLGMGVVFSFLVILILCISLTSKLIRALKLDKNEESVNGVGSSNATGTQNNAIIAAIAAAVRQKQR